MQALLIILELEMYDFIDRDENLNHDLLYQHIFLLHHIIINLLVTLKL